MIFSVLQLWRIPPHVIKATQLDGREIYLNADLIESLESTPETMVVLSNQRRLLVRESVTELVDRVIEYRRKIRGFTIWYRGRDPETGDLLQQELDSEGYAEVPATDDATYAERGDADEADDEEA